MQNRRVLRMGWWMLPVVAGAVVLARPVVGSTPGAAVTAEARMDVKKIADEVKAELLTKHGAAHKARIDRGVDQVAALWRPEDGDLMAFAREHFMADPAAVGSTLVRLEQIMEQLDGHFNEMGRELRRPTDVEMGPMLAVDPLLAGLDPGAHVTDDLFASRIAFVALLNFPLTTLQERLKDGATYSRDTWAAVRLTGRFGQRVPAPIKQDVAKVAAEADMYIAGYNIWMHHVLDAKGQRVFPSGKRLISHWNLRDEIKANYKDPKGLEKQRLITKVMERIVTQTIPAAVIDNPHVDWDPVTNRVTPAPAAEIEANAPPPKTAAGNEPDTRYTHLLASFNAVKRADPFVPVAPTAMARSFDMGREIPESRASELLKQVLTSPVVPKVAAEVQKRLGRKLEPHDIWYAGFKHAGTQSEADLDAVCQKKYPTAEAFAADIPRILEALGFAKDRAAHIAKHIVVDPSRGAGHAMQANRRGDFPRLRTRVEKTGMNYKGYNIAVHELGHNVEQYVSLYDVDHTLLQGVPNAAFTEAMAFMFQARDLELLGQSKPDAAAEKARVLKHFWDTWEIAGVALVDIAVWHWMYDHPQATPAELREAVVAISKEHWNKYYAPVLGGKDSPQLGIYSHMIAFPLYLTDYPLGHLIAFQIEEHMKKFPAIGGELERMAKYGAVTPDLWMQNATGAPVSAEPLLRATEKALKIR